MRELVPQHLLRRISGTPSQASNIIYLNRKVVTPCRSAASRDRPEAGLRKGVTPPRRAALPAPCLAGYRSARALAKAANAPRRKA